MPDRGRLDPLSITAGPILRGELAAPWAISQARWTQVTFEVDRAAALTYLSEDVTRPIPCYARVLVLDAMESPVGPFRLAALLVGGRLRLKPRNVLALGIVDGPAALIAGAFGAPFLPGRVSLEHAEDRAALAAWDESGMELFEAEVAGLRTIDPAMLRWDPWLGYACRGDNVELVEYRLEPTDASASLANRAQLVVPPELPPESPWRRLRSVNMITACACEGSLVLTAPEVLEAPE